MPYQQRRDYADSADGEQITLATVYRLPRPQTPSAPDVRGFAHLTAEQVTVLGDELDAIRAKIVDSLGQPDADYIRRIIGLQRGLAAGGRVALFASLFPPAWLAGTAMLSAAKIIENMELGHNVMHGQWDWMNDPEVHSSTWEWDTACPADEWKHSHNAIHHVYTNVVGKDRDVGYGVLRMTPDEKWQPVHLAQPFVNAALAMFFQYGVALHDLEIERVLRGQKGLRQTLGQGLHIANKIRKQITKDYVVYPLLAGPAAPAVLTANMTANLVRNLWSYMIIFCGHFPDGSQTFTEDELENESRGAWYLRQMLGSANIEGSPFFHLMAGNLGYQIEHHLFPDIPSSRYAEISEDIRALCAKYDLPYTTGPLHRQYGQTLRTILRLSLP
jgi:linoleoyl-CoA desaturase